jgi:hypothetical protein
MTRICLFLAMLIIQIMCLRNLNSFVFRKDVTGKSIEVPPIFFERAGEQAMRAESRSLV